MTSQIGEVLVSFEFEVPNESTTVTGWSLIRWHPLKWVYIRHSKNPSSWFWRFCLVVAEFFVLLYRHTTIQCAEHWILSSTFYAPSTIGNLVIHSPEKKVKCLPWKLATRVLWIHSKIRDREQSQAPSTADAAAAVSTSSMLLQTMLVLLNWLQSE